jgi:hypothetical protein
VSAGFQYLHYAVMNSTTIWVEYPDCYPFIWVLHDPYANA